MMASRTTQRGLLLLQSVSTKQSIQQSSKAFRKPPSSARSLHAASPTARYSRASFYNGYSAATAGALTLASLGLWLHHNGIQLQLLSVAQADEPAPAGTITPHVALDETPLHLDPDTSIPFPSTLTPIGSSSDSLKLIGLGVRTVSFIRVKVYSAGAYFSEKALEAIKGQSQLLEDGKGEKLISYILDQPYDVSVRIVPTRNTDHSHLRDGFVRAMLARMKQATSAKTLSDEQAEKAGSDLDDFKGFFPSGKVSKGKYMLITRRGSDGALLLEYEGKLLGTLKNSFLSKEMLLAYFADNDKEISPKLKSDVMAGLEHYL